MVIDPPGGFSAVGVRTMVPLAHLSWSACWIGAAQEMLRIFVHLLRDPSTRHQLPQLDDAYLERLARVRYHTDLADAVLLTALQEYQRRADGDLDGGDGLDVPEFHILINNLKVAAAEHAYEAVDILLDLAGFRFGYQRNPSLPLERVFRDLRSAGLMYGNQRLLRANGKLTLFDARARSFSRTATDTYRYEGRETPDAH